MLSDHCSISASTGGTPGGNGASREVFPLGAFAPRARSWLRTWLARGERIRQVQIVVQVAARRRAAAFCAARLVDPVLERSPTAVPWRERPPL